MAVEVKDQNDSGVLRPNYGNVLQTSGFNPGLAVNQKEKHQMQMKISDGQGETKPKHEWGKTSVWY